MDGVSDAHGLVPVPHWAARRRFSVADYHKMGATGVLREDDPIELIGGELIVMAPIGGPHIAAVMALGNAFFAAVAARATVSIQNSLRLDEWNEPEPDVVLLRPRSDKYWRDEPPLAAEALLVVEVADSSLAYDREVKVPLYARHGIPEVWVVDIAGGAIEVSRNPDQGRYTDTFRAERGTSVEPLACPGARIAVVDVVPPV